ncbi:hypothetical protein [Vibrio parahaemolyticus]|uniref:hypothetical protein n=1 Tax=Vibrio parahaemolyticus TaxID=670 RepID=UPI003B679063
MAIYFNGQEILTLNLDGTKCEAVTLDGVTVARKPVITTQPVGGTITDAESKTLSVAADGLGSTMSYQWYKSDGTAISGATGTSYTFDPTSTGSFGFYCRVTGFGGYKDTSTVTVVVEVSWTHTITKGYISGTGIEAWGFADESAVHETYSVGDLSPRSVADGVTCGEISSGLLFGLENSESVWMVETLPETSYIVLETSSGTWIANFREHTDLSPHNTIYELDQASREWLRTESENEKIKLTYYSS